VTLGAAVSGGEFNKMRRALRHFIRRCLADLPIAEEVTSELNENLAQFNRRSFLRKLKRLSMQWQVPLDGISDDMLIAAKRARDYVVHRGKYCEGVEEVPLDLWRHVAVIREIAARFLMVAIGYTGRDQTYIGAPRDVMFPPTTSQAQTK
jgi:hypothetical protein